MDGEFPEEREERLSKERKALAAQKMQPGEGRVNVTQ